MKVNDNKWRTAERNIVDPTHWRLLPPNPNAAFMRPSLNELTMPSDN